MIVSLVSTRVSRRLDLPTRRRGDREPKHASRGSDAIGEGVHLANHYRLGRTAHFQQFLCRLHIQRQHGRQPEPDELRDPGFLIARVAAPAFISLTETGLSTNGSYPVFTSYNTGILNSTSTVQFQTFYDVTDTPFEGVVSGIGRVGLRHERDRVDRTDNAAGKQPHQPVLADEGGDADNRCRCLPNDRRTDLHRPP